MFMTGGYGGPRGSGRHSAEDAAHAAFLADPLQQVDQGEFVATVRQPCAPQPRPGAGRSCRRPPFPRARSPSTGPGGGDDGHTRRSLSHPAGTFDCMATQPSAAAGERRLAVLEGVLERITYANEENGYTVA